MKTLIAFLVLLFPGVIFSVTTPCTRVFQSESFPLPYTLPLGDQEFVFTVDQNANAATFSSMELYTEIESANTQDIKIRIRKNSGGIQKIVRNIGGTNADLYDGTTFFDGAVNTIATVKAAASDGVITPIDPQQPFSNLGTISPGDTITVLIRSSTPGVNIVNAIELTLNLEGCSTTSVPTTPEPTTTPIPTQVCTREWIAYGDKSNIVPADRDVVFDAEINTNIDSGTFLYWGVYVDIDSALSNEVTVRVSDLVTTKAIIRGNGGANANIWAGVSVFDEATTPVSSISSYTPEVSPLFPLSSLTDPTSGDTYRVLIKTGDSNGITVNEVKIFAVLKDCGTTVAPTSPPAPTTTPVPTTPDYCTAKFPVKFGLPDPITFTAADRDLVFNIPIQANLNNGNFHELRVFVDIDSPLSDEIVVRLSDGGTTIPLIRSSGGANANIWAGVTLSDSASVRSVDVTSYTPDVSPNQPISTFGTPNVNDQFQILIKTGDGANSATLNDLYMEALLSDCSTVATPTTLLPTTTPAPTPEPTTPIPTTPAVECVRTYTHPNLPETVNFIDGFGRPLFVSQQTGGTVVWMEVYTDIQVEDTELLIMEFSAEGTGQRRELTPGGFGGQVGIFGGTTWKNSAALNIKDVQSSGESVPIPELAPFEPFNFFGSNAMAISINQELRLVIQYSGSGNVTLNGFSVTFGMINCQPTVTPPPTTSPPTTSPPTTSPPTTSPPTTSPPTTSPPTTSPPTTSPPTTSPPTPSPPTTSPPTTSPPTTSPPTTSPPTTSPPTTSPPTTSPPTTSPPTTSPPTTSPPTTAEPTTTEPSTTEPTTTDPNTSGPA